MTRAVDFFYKRAAVSEIFRLVFPITTDTRESDFGVVPPGCAPCEKVFLPKKPVIPTWLAVEEKNVFPCWKKNVTLARPCDVQEV